MDLKQIKELMAAMEKAGIKKMRVKEEKGFEIELVREEEHLPSVQSTVHMLPPVHEHFIPHHQHPTLPPRQIAEGEKTVEKSGKYVTSPMVGTFYASPSPDDPPFVKVGDRVEEGTILCIIEAMKVMNEVKAGTSGTIAEILVDSAQPVEFGTKIFRIV
ncbi:MAG TPA: acetyl-CoA carboxylase biotin carboxyl carrier protein [Rhabdochlamydiaceae bacterium]|nr:acetyl-CoA carboxylase biotin carboxyl carrier protein [Rhabdochlamydiaceae bacterium]